MQGHSHDIVDQKKSPCHHKDSGNEIADRPRIGCIHPGGIVGQIGGKSHLAKAQIRNDLLRLGIQIFRMPEHDTKGNLLPCAGFLPQLLCLVGGDPGAGLGVDVLPGPETADGKLRLMLLPLHIQPGKLYGYPRPVRQT